MKIFISLSANEILHLSDFITTFNATKMMNLALFRAKNELLFNFYYNHELSPSSAPNKNQNIEKEEGKQFGMKNTCPEKTDVELESLATPVFTRGISSFSYLTNEDSSSSSEESDEENPCSRRKRKMGAPIKSTSDLCIIVGIQEFSGTITESEEKSNVSLRKRRDEGMKVNERGRTEREGEDEKMKEYREREREENEVEASSVFLGETVYHSVSDPRLFQNQSNQIASSISRHNHNQPIPFPNQEAKSIFRFFVYLLILSHRNPSRIG